jgi:hypothetical protein
MLNVCGNEDVCLGWWLARDVVSWLILDGLGGDETRRQWMDD